jgi:hypothetical protein
MMLAPGQAREVHIAARIEGQSTLRPRRPRSARTSARLFTIVDRLHPGHVGPVETGQLALSREAAPGQGSMVGMGRSQLVHILATGTPPKPEEKRR